MAFSFSELDTLASLVVQKFEEKSFEFYSAEEVAEKLHIKVAEVNRKFSSGELVGKKKGKHWFISKKKLFESLFGLEKKCDSKSTADPL